MRRMFPYVLIALAVFAAAGSAQSISRYERPIHTPVFIPPVFHADTTAFPRSENRKDTTGKLFLNEDSLIAAQIGVSDTTILPPKSTVIALLGSAVLPGAGQIYNESYWKAPVVWGFGYYFYSVYHRQDRLYKEKRALYESTLNAIDTASTTIIRNNLSDEADKLKGLRDFYKNQRNEFGWYLAITYVLNMVDAYVDAALFNFEVSPNLQGTNDWRMNVRVPIRR